MEVLPSRAAISRWRLLKLRKPALLPGHHVVRCSTTCPNAAETVPHRTAFALALDLVLALLCSASTWLLPSLENIGVGSAAPSSQRFRLRLPPEPSAFLGRKGAANAPPPSSSRNRGEAHTWRNQGEDLAVPRAGALHTPAAPPSRSV